jgi:hypothetical protein
MISKPKYPCRRELQTAAVPILRNRRVNPLTGRGWQSLACQ